MEIIYNVGPPFDSSVGANNSNNLVYGTQIAIYSYGVYKPT